jgi:sulfur relay (sulfurtransferase) DsrF/TusC family protein
MPTRCDEPFVNFDAGTLFRIHGWIVKAVQFCTKNQLFLLIDGCFQAHSGSVSQSTNRWPPVAAASALVLGDADHVCASPPSLDPFGLDWRSLQSG